MNALGAVCSSFSPDDNCYYHTTTVSTKTWRVQKRATSDSGVQCGRGGGGGRSVNMFGKGEGKEEVREGGGGQGGRSGG